MRRPRFQSVFAAILALFIAPAIATAQVPDFSAMYVFGDSLADSGNFYVTTKLLGANPPVPPSKHPLQAYFEGRFSNGYVGVEFLWERLSGNAPGSPNGMRAFVKWPLVTGDSAVNFAYGGTGTPFLDQTPGGLWAPGLKGQIELFKGALRGRVPQNALFVISTGSNDYRDDPFNVPMSPAVVVGNISEAIARLYQIGARHIAVVDLPDFGLLPLYAGDPGQVSELSVVHNTLLDTAVSALRDRFPMLHLVTIRLNPLLLQLVGSLEWQVPALEVFSGPGQSACVFINPALCQDASPGAFNNLHLGFLFWDVSHPTTEAHHALGDYMYDELVNSY